MVFCFILFPSFFLSFFWELLAFSVLSRRQLDKTVRPKKKRLIWLTSAYSPLPPAHFLSSLCSSPPSLPPLPISIRSLSLRPAPLPLPHLPPPISSLVKLSTSGFSVLCLLFDVLHCKVWEVFRGKSGRFSPRNVNIDRVKPPSLLSS